MADMKRHAFYVVFHLKKNVRCLVICFFFSGKSKMDKYPLATL